MASAGKAIRRARVEGLNSIATQLKVDGKQIINYTDSLHNSEDCSFLIAVSAYHRVGQMNLSLGGAPNQNIVNEEKDTNNNKNNHWVLTDCIVDSVIMVAEAAAFEHISLFYYH